MGWDKNELKMLRKQKPQPQPFQPGISFQVSVWQCDIGSGGGGGGGWVR